MKIEKREEYTMLKDNRVLDFLKKFKNWIIIGILFIVLAVIRILLIMKLPVFAYIDYVDDDELMVQQAKSIICGNWLGIYSYNTLLKGPVFPLYLALLYFLKLPYLLTTTALYIIACCIFICSLKNVINNKLVLLIIYISILFNPIMFSINFQRVYRNSLTPVLALLLISFYNILLIYSNEKRIYKFLISIISISIIFPFFYYIREDSIWIIPFIIFYSIIIIVKLIKEMISNKKISNNILKILLLFLPIISLVIFKFIIGNINYQYYNAKVVNVSDFDNLNNAIHMISIVKDYNEKEPSTNSRNKMRRLYELSPSLNMIKDEFEISLDIIAGYPNGEVPNGMFSWALLSGITRSGYTTFEEQNELLGNIAKELEKQIQNGNCEVQRLMPIFNDVNVKMFNLKTFKDNTIEAIDLINDYSSFSLMDTYGSLYTDSEFFEVRVRLFLELTNDRVLLNDEESSWRNFGELVKSNQKEYINQMQPKIELLKKIQVVYTKIANNLKIIGYISYIIDTIILLIFVIKRNYKYLNHWIISSGIIGSVFTLCLGVAYTSTTKVYATVAFYLMSAYILNLIFIVFSIVTLISMIKDIKQLNKIKQTN